MIDLEKSIAYCQSQQQRHSVTVVNDCQQRLPGFAWPPSGDTATPEGLDEEAKAERDYKGEALISLSIYHQRSDVWKLKRWERMKLLTKTDSDDT